MSKNDAWWGYGISTPVSSHGQSKHTLFKEYRFLPIFKQSLGISKAASVARWPYYHIDLNSGPGYNDVAQIEGSPLNFLRAVEEQERLNFQAFFIDRNADAVLALRARPEVQKYHGKQVTTHIGDNTELLPVVSTYIHKWENKPQYAMGSLVIDPDGYHNGVPWAALREFCIAHPRIDVIMNLNISTYCWVQGNVRLGRDRKNAGENLHPLSSFPTWFSRANWMLTDVTSSGGHRWIQLVGRTIKTHSPSYERIGFYDYYSTKGQQIIADIERLKEYPSRSEYLPLFDD